MATVISLFNHKGGVSKTTTAFNLGWAMAAAGKRVLLADFDPQCNLTGMVMGFQGVEDLEATYSALPANNVKDGLAPAFESQHGKYKLWRFILWPEESGCSFCGDTLASRSTRLHWASRRS